MLVNISKRRTRGPQSVNAAPHTSVPEYSAWQKGNGDSLQIINIKSHHSSHNIF